MSIKITNPGPLSTFQDFGRTGYQKQGFPVNGAMDQDAMILANCLTNNPAGEAVIEMTIAGITAIFEETCVISLTGADCTPLINNKPIPMNTAVVIQKGQILRCPMAVNGCRSYLAVSGGFGLPLIMGSASTNLKCGIGGLQGRKLEKGDLIPLKKPCPSLSHMERRTLPYVPYLKELTVRAVFGPQDDAFTEEGITLFQTQAFKVRPDSDRMGMRLDGPSLPCKKSYDIISDGIAAGSIQVTASGQPIILLSDRQTTGGYAKIAAVITADLPMLAQARPGDTLHFALISIETAQQIYTEKKAAMQALQRRINS